MASRFFALVVWAAVAASVAYWGLRWLSRPAAVPANATPVSLDAAVKGDLRRLLLPPAKPTAGAAQNLSEAATLTGRLKLLGVVAPRNEGETSGVALLSLDGKPARAVRIGMVIDGDYMLRTIDQHSIGIGKADGPVAASMDLPLMPPPATGALVTPPVLRSTSMPSVAAMQGGQQTPPSDAGNQAAPQGNDLSTPPGRPTMGRPGMPPPGQRNGAQGNPAGMPPPGGAPQQSS
jgi:general secretion pathway protein C